jgi:hypothetical protein
VLFVHTLPAVVPEGEFPRSEIVPVRLARRVAPLFGVRWAHNPYDCTWVCDFTALTLTEIARGAPLPVGAEPAAIGPDGMTPIAKATLNRFGPHTKSAVILTAANRLLVDATAAVTTVCQDVGQQNLPRSLRLAIWAGLVLEVFRAQPALVVAAIQARSVQRSLTAQWGDHAAFAPSITLRARSEIGATTGSAIDRALTPVRFALIDDTLSAVDLTTPGAPGGTPLGAERRDDLASAWARRLLRMGRPGSGVVWLHEDDPGHRTAHAYQRVGAMIAPFVGEALNTDLLDTDLPPADIPLPSWPDDEALGHTSPLAVRAYAVGLHATAAYLHYLKTPAQRWPPVKVAVRDLVGHATAAVGRRLGTDDPAHLLLTGFLERLVLEDALRDGEPPEAIRAAVTRQLDGLRRTRQAWHAGRLAPGTTSYLLEIDCVALGEALDQAGDALDDDLRTVIGRALARTWREALAARGIPDEPTSVLASLTDSQVFHLFRYAEHLARRGGTPDLRRALAVLDAVTEVRDKVAHDEPAGIVVKHTAARQAHQLACSVAWRLSSMTSPRERTASARAQEAAERHLRAVLADPSAEAILAAPGHDRTLSWALDSVGPALLDLLRRDPASLDPAELRTARRLVTAVEPPRTGFVTELAEALARLG